MRDEGARDRNQRVGEEDRREKKARQKRAKQRQAVEALGGRAAFDAVAEALRERSEKRRLWEERNDDKARVSWRQWRSFL